MQANPANEPPDEPPDAAVVDAVLLASRVLVAVAARSLATAPTDITLPQYRALVVLASRGPQRASALAEELDIQPSSVTRLCDRLESKGLIVRAVAPTSRREVEIELSATGRRVVDRVTLVRRREIGRIVAAVPVERRQLLVTALAEFAAAAGEVPHQDWSLGWGR